MNRQNSLSSKISRKGSLSPSQLENSESGYSKLSGFLGGLPETVGAMSPASYELSFADCYDWKPYVSHF